MFQAVGLGALAGMAASLVQVLVGLVLDRIVLPPHQHNNIAPRFVKRLFQLGGRPARPVRDWSLGTIFHFGYGAGWGCLFGLARRQSGLPSPLLAGVTGLLIYLLAFSGIGAGTRTSTERHPRHRSWRKQLSLVTIVATFALTTAGVYDRLTDRTNEPE